MIFIPLWLSLNFFFLDFLLLWKLYKKEFEQIEFFNYKLHIQYKRSKKKTFQTYYLAKSLVLVKYKFWKYRPRLDIIDFKNSKPRVDFSKLPKTYCKNFVMFLFCNLKIAQKYNWYVELVAMFTKMIFYLLISMS